MKVKALYANLGFNKNQAGEIVEYPEQDAKHLIEVGLAEAVEEPKKVAPVKKAPARSTKAKTKE